MKFVVEYPVASDVDAGSWLEPTSITTFARAAEGAGFHAIVFPDHPAPTNAWMASGGIETLDPFVALAFCAAATDQLRLMTRVLVVPYRNPLLAAKAMASLDIVSGGRTIFVLGSGYQRDEFDALGVDFDERNELLDEGVDVFRTLWTTDRLGFAGRHFSVTDQYTSPRPRQLPHPPLWFGGNSVRMRDRVARFGTGWSPAFGVRPEVTRGIRTAHIGSLGELGDAIADLRDRVRAAERNPDAVDVLAGCAGTDLTIPMSAQQRVDELQELADVGVTQAMIRTFPKESPSFVLDVLERFGRDVIGAGLSSRQTRKDTSA
jgi:probable F420-dependent oxidoreductase